MSDAVLAATAKLSLAPALATPVKAARHLAGARCATIGVPDADGDGAPGPSPGSRHRTSGA